MQTVLSFLRETKVIQDKKFNHFVSLFSPINCSIVLHIINISIGYDIN